MRAFCPLLRTDLRLSSFLDSAAKKSKGPGGGDMCVQTDRLVNVYDLDE